MGRRVVVVNETPFETAALRALVTAASAYRRAGRQLRSVTFRTQWRPRRGFEGEPDGSAYIRTGDVVIFIPPSWRVIRDERLVLLAQTLDHEVLHVVQPTLPHHHMPCVYSEPVPYTAGLGPIKRAA